MPYPEVQLGKEQPAAQSPAPGDSTPSNGFQPGGFSPKAAAALALLPSEHRGVLESELAAKNLAYTQQGQLLAGNAEKAKALDTIVGNQDFKLWYSALQSGGLPGYHRSQLGMQEPGPGAVAPDEPQQLSMPSDDSLEGVTPAEFEVMKAAVTEMRGRLGNVEGTVADREQQIVVEEFREEFGKDDPWLGGMQSVKSDYPDMHIRDARILAEGRAQRQPASASPAETPQQQSLQPEPAPPIPGVGVSIGELPVTHKPAGSRMTFAERALAHEAQTGADITKLLEASGGLL